MNSAPSSVRVHPHVFTIVFAAGYLLVWALFSAAATAAQWSLDWVGLLSPMMRTTSLWLGAGILISPNGLIRLCEH